MKSRVTNNLGLKLLSIFFAIGLWMVVVNVSDPVTTKTFKNIPVSFKNENVLSEDGKVYQVLEGSDSISFTVKAKRSVLEALTKADFRAEADFSERIAENSVPVKVSVLRFEENILDVDLLKNTVKIAIEEEVNKTLKVELKIEGNTAEGRTVGNTQISPAEVNLKGPQSVVKYIDKMVVVLDAGDAQADIDTVLEGQLFNKNGELVDDSRIICDTKEFNVKAKLLHTKSVDLDFSVEGTVKDGYRYIDMKYEPTTVLIAGEQEDLDNISTIVFPSALLNLEGADKNIVKKVDVSDYLPDKLSIANNEDKEIQVTLNIVPLITQDVVYPVTKIDVLNTPSGLDVSFEGNLSLSFVLRGLSEDFANMSVYEDLDVSVDVKGLSEGTHKVPVKIDTGNNIEVVDIPNVEVTLSSTVENNNIVLENNGTTSTTTGVGSN